MKEIIKSIFDKPQPQSTVIIHSRRRWGEPKLVKPQALKNNKKSFSVDWIPKRCRCSCFILENDVYVLHRDFGSINVYGSAYKGKSKFIYNDNFGCVVLRGEAWLVLKDLVLDIQNEVFEVKIFQSLAEQISGSLGSFEWERFFERIIHEYKSNILKGR